MVYIWIKDQVFKNLGRRLHGETSCKLFGTLHEPVCQTKWKAAGCRSSCLVKISVYFGLLTHHPCFSELSLKPLGKVRVPICTRSMLSCLLHSPAEALQRVKADIHLMGRNSLISGHLCSETSCLWKNMLSSLNEIFIPLVLSLLCLSYHVAFYIFLLS